MPTAGIDPQVLPLARRYRRGPAYGESRLLAVSSLARQSLQA